MIADASTGTFKYVIVYMFDRFARNRIDSMMYKHQLKDKHGVRVISAVEPVSDDEGGELYEMFLEWNAEKYSQRLSTRIKDGLTTAIEKGTFTGGYLVYGYTTQDTCRTGKKGSIKRIVIDEEQAEVIRYIFTEYAKGTQKERIAEALNAMGHRVNGKPFRARTFEKWLCNAKYTGEFMYGGRVCSNMFPPIISKELFDKVQAKLKHNSHYAKSCGEVVKEKYLLSGKLYCGHCGELMVGEGGTGRHGVRYNYYTCKQARRKQCCKTRENKAELEQFVTEETVRFFNDPVNLEKCVSDVIAHYQRISDNNAIKSIDTRIANTRKEITDTTNAFVQAVAVGSVSLQKHCKVKMDELETLLNDLQNQRSKLELEKGMALTRKDIVSFIAEFTAGNPADKEFKKRLIDNLAHTVYSYNGRDVIYFTVRGGNKELPKISKEYTDRAVGKATNSAKLNTSSSESQNATLNSVDNSVNADTAKSAKTNAGKLNAENIVADTTPHKANKPHQKGSFGGSFTNEGGGDAGN